MCSRVTQLLPASRRSVHCWFEEQVGCRIASPRPSCQFSSLWTCELPSPELINLFNRQNKLAFALPCAEKQQLLRRWSNKRGYSGQVSSLVPVAPLCWGHTLPCGKLTRGAKETVFPLQQEVWAMKPCQNAVEAQLKNYTEDIHILPSLYQPEGFHVKETLVSLVRLAFKPPFWAGFERSHVT